MSTIIINLTLLVDVYDIKQDGARQTGGISGFLNFL
jgi:hypothetical protein